MGTDSENRTRRGLKKCEQGQKERQPRVPRDGGGILGNGERILAAREREGFRSE